MSIETVMALMPNCKINKYASGSLAKEAGALYLIKGANISIKGTEVYTILDFNDAVIQNFKFGKWTVHEPRFWVHKFEDRTIGFSIEDEKGQVRTKYFSTKLTFDQWQKIILNFSMLGTWEAVEYKEKCDELELEIQQLKSTIESLQKK